jgi:hypothetical protein
VTRGVLAVRRSGSEMKRNAEIGLFTKSSMKEEGMTIARMTAIGLAALLLMGCAGASKLNSVRLGMTKDQVISAVGSPSSTSEMGNTQYLKYQLCSDWIFTDRYYVRLTDGQVDAFGRVGDFNLGY